MQGASERVRGHRQMKAGAWAQCQATAAARRATPAQSGHAAGKLCHGRDARRGASASSARRQASAALGWAGARWKREARGGFAGPACGAGPERRRRPRKNRNGIFQLIFKKILKCHHSNIILSKKMTSFENVPKMKIA